MVVGGRMVVGGVVVVEVVVGGRLVVGEMVVGGVEDKRGGFLGVLQAVEELLVVEEVQGCEEMACRKLLLGEKKQLLTLLC